MTFVSASILSDVFNIEWGLRKLVFRECDLDEFVRLSTSKRYTVLTAKLDVEAYASRTAYSRFAILPLPSVKPTAEDARISFDRCISHEGMISFQFSRHSSDFNSRPKVFNSSTYLRTLWTRNQLNISWPRSQLHLIQDWFLCVSMTVPFGRQL